MAETTIDEIVAVIRAELGDFKKGMKEVESTADKATSEVKNKFSVLGSSIQDIGKKMSLYVTLPLTALAVKATASFNAQEKAITLVDSALRATGGTVGFTTQELTKMSAELQKVSTFGDEDIMQNVTLGLLKFRTVTGDVFKSAQQVIIDYATQTGTSLEGATQQIGRALEDPTTGLTLLRRAGVVFTDQQEKMIQKMLRVGDVAGAQGIIIHALEGKFKGAAKAMADSNPGQLAQAWNAVDDALEEVGKAISEFLIPAAHVVKDLAIQFQGLSPETKKFLVVTGGIAAIMGPIIKIVGMLVSAWGFLSKAVIFLTPLWEGLGAVIAGISAPVAIAVAAIGALVFAVVHWWDEIKAIGRAAARIFQPVTDAFNYLKDQAVEAIMGLWDSLRDWATTKMGQISNFVSGKIDDIVSFFVDMGGRIKAGIEAWTPDIVKKGIKLFGEFMKPARDFVANGLDIVREELGKTGKAAEQAGPPISLMGKNMQEAGKNGAAALQTISPQAQEVRDKLKELAFQTLVARGEFKNLEKGAPELLNQLGLLADQNSRLSTEAMQVNEAMRQLRLATEGKSIFEATRTDAEKYSEGLNHLNELLVTGAINTDTYNRAVVQLQEQFSASTKVISKMVDIIGTNFSNFIGDAIFDSKRLEEEYGTVAKAFQKMIDSLLEEIVRFLISSIVKDFLNIITGGLFGGGGGGGLLGAIFGSAKGNAFTGPIQPFAAGGVTSGPIAFPMGGGKTGVAGEAGPEAIFPIVRTRNGDLGVRAEVPSPGRGGGAGEIGPIWLVNKVMIGERELFEVVTQGVRDGRITIPQRSVR